MNFFKRGNMFNVFFRLGGRQFSLSTGETVLEKAQVQGARIFLAHVDRGSTGEVKTIKEAIELYWRWHATPSKDPKPEWVSAHKYEVCLLKVCALLKISDLAPLAQAAPSITAKSLGVRESNYVSLVRQAAALFNLTFLTWSSAQGKTLVNPFAGHVPPVSLQKRFNPPPVSLIQALNAEAEKELGRNELLIFKLCLGAGLRAGEATFLPWSNILERSVFVESTSTKKTKNKKSREVPVSPGLIAFFDRHRGIPEHYVVSDILPPKLSKYGQPLRRSDRAAKSLNSWLKAKGVPGPRRTHWLRKCFASIVTQHHDIYTASRWLGHSSVRVTEAIYAGVAADRFAAVV